MTVNEALSRAREARPSALPDATLLRILNDTEERILTEWLGTDAGGGTRYAAANAAELLLLPPYDEFYLYTLLAETDYLLGETDLYRNDRARADAMEEDIRLLLCRRGRRAVFGTLLRLTAGASVTMTLGGIALADEDVSAVTVTFRAGGVSVLVKTEEDEGVCVAGHTLFVPLSAEDVACLTPGTVTATASLLSRDGAVTAKSETLRLFVKGEDA